MKKVINGFGVIDHSPIEVSEALVRMRVSHTIEGGYMRHMVRTLDGLCDYQPAWPVVIDTLKAVPKVRTERDPMIYLICDSRAALANTNTDKLLWDTDNGKGGFDHMLRVALNVSRLALPKWALQRNDPSIDDYVNASSKPSFMNNVQTAIYKISPYDFRKEVQGMVIMYLSSRTGPAKLKAKLRSSFKLDPLAELLSDPRARALREACETLIRTGMDAEVIAKNTGVASFDMLYLVNSSRKLSE